MAAFKTIDKRHRLSALVEEQIDKAIRSKKFLPGSQLPTELALCKQFGVSRTAVREALRMLSARGLVTVVKGKGIFVREISAETVTTPLHLYLQMSLKSDHVIDIVHARQIIEPSIASSAAVHHTSEDLERLRRDVENLKASDGNFEHLAHLDMQFHLDIARASENPILPLILEPIHRLLPQIKSSVYASVSDAQQSAIEWHSKIVDAIVARDADGARRAMTEHLKIAEEHARLMLKKQEQVVAKIQADKA